MPTPPPTLAAPLVPPLSPLELEREFSTLISSLHAFRTAIISTPHPFVPALDAIARTCLNSLLRLHPHITRLTDKSRLSPSSVS